LIGDPARSRSMGLVGRQMVMERHNADRMAREIKSIYTRLLERTSPKTEPA
jgi:hypothetical protein